MHPSGISDAGSAGVQAVQEEVVSTFGSCRQEAVPCSCLQGAAEAAHDAASAKGKQGRQAAVHLLSFFLEKGMGLRKQAWRE